MATFIQDDSIQGTTSSILELFSGIPLYAYNTNLSSLSSYSYLYLNNLNTTSTTIFNNLNSLSTNSTLSINNLNNTSTTIFNNLNSLSTNSILNINGHTTQISNLNNTSTTIFNNLNSLSTNSILNINGHTTQISNLNNTSTTIFNNLNSLSTNSILSINGHTTQISNLNNTSTTIFNNLNSLSTNSIFYINNLNTTSTTVFNNLNSLSTNSIFYINNINNTSTTIFNNLNSLSTNSTLSINNLNATSTTIFANLTTSNSVFMLAINNLRATSTTIFNNLNSLSTNSILSINNLNATSTTIFNNLNSLSTNSTLSINNLNATSTTLFNKTNFTNLLVSNASTINSSLNVVGNIIASGTALTNLNYNSILNPPSLVSFNNPSTFISTLNISGNTNLNNVTTINSSLNVSGLTTLSGNIECGGGIALTGSNAFHNIPSVDAGNYSNTYINFKGAGAGSDWAYLRQIGGNESIKLALDFHDDAADARFCIRNISSVSIPDNPTEVFTVDNGNVKCTGKIEFKGELVNQYWKFTNDSDYCRLNGVGGGYFNFAANNLYSSGIIYASGDKLNFLDTLNQYKINLWGANTYGFGIASETLQYSSYNYHRFYNSSNNLNTFTIDGTGNASCTGALNVTGITTLNNTTIIYGQLSTNGNFTNGTTSNLYAGGLRINGSDYNNTIYQDLTTIGTHSADIGFTLRNYSFFNFNSLSSGNINTNLCNMSMAGISLNKTVTCGSSLNVNGTTYITGNTGIGISNPNCRLYISTNAGNNVNSFAIRVSSGGGTDGSGFATLIGLGAESGGWSKCAIGHTRTNGYDVGDIVFLNRNTIDNADCTMSDEKMRITSAGNVSCTGSIGCAGISASGSSLIGNARVSSYLSIQNANPWAPLNVGDCSAATDGFINFGKNSGGNRNCKVGYNSGFTFCIGDFGNVNNNSNNWSQQFGISYQAPQASLGIDSTGRVIMPNGYGTSSDERIKTNIKTIENALDKTLLLRGVEYNDIRVDPDKKRIGLIAQEVELIIPEVVGEGEMDKIKYISYGPLVGLLIEAIKDQQKQINELKNILKNNNLN